MSLPEKLLSLSTMSNKKNSGISQHVDLKTDRNGNDLSEIRRSEIWKQLFNAIRVPVLVVRPNGIIIEVNDATLQAARKDRGDIIGQGICEIVHGGAWPHIKCPLEEFLKTCAPKIEETRLPGLYGEYSLTISPVKEVDGKVDRIMLIARELTRDEIRKVDAIRTSKLAAIGELAAGVAHEINNPITGIINFAQILLDNYKLDSTGKAIVQNIIKEGDRIASISHNLLSFSREGTGDRAPINPENVILESLALVNHQLKKDGIEVVTEFPETSPNIVADFSKLQQVLLNLISNSRYALNQRYDGFDPQKIIEITCEYKPHSEKNVYRIIVKDYGTGLPQSILERLFEPFFTTKPPGEGTGLGLSISYGIIKDHGGNMYVNAILKKFTEMVIELPAGI